MIIASYPPDPRSLTVSQTLFATLYSAASDEIDVVLNQMYALEIYGNPSVNDKYNLINDFHYLMFLLYMAKMEQNNDLLNGTDNGIAYYYDSYHLACARRYFDCKQINIMPIIQAVGLYVAITGSAGAIGTGSVGVEAVTGYGEVGTTGDIVIR